MIADLSVHYVEGFILEEGHLTRRLDSDYSYDLIMRTFDELGYAEPGLIFLQMKASDKLKFVENNAVFDADIRDYNLWIHEEMPVVLILFDASKKRAYWICVQQYFKDTPSSVPARGAKTTRIRISKRRVINQKAVEAIRSLKSVYHRPKLRLLP